MSSREADEYVLGTHDAELERLGFQHRIWSEQAFGIWDRAGFKYGDHLLDLGSGPGFATLDLARMVGPHGRIIAADASSRFLEYLVHRQAAEQIGNVQTIEVDLHDLQLPGNSLDGAYARWVLCFVADPARVVARVGLSLRPGGVFAVQDYFNYTSLTLAPRSAILEKVVKAVDASWRAHGGDPDVMARMPAMMEAAGLRVREIRSVCRVARPGSLLWQWPTTFFRNFVPALVESGYLSRSDQETFEAEWKARSQDVNTFFCTPPVYDIIAEKANR